MMTHIGSRQVASLLVYDLLAPFLGDPGLIPGTPAWADLDDTDPRKWSAVLWSAMWWAVDADARQAAMADASREISTAVDWKQVAREKQQLDAARKAGIHIPRSKDDAA